MLMVADGVEAQDLITLLNTASEKLQREPNERGRPVPATDAKRNAEYRPGVGIVLLNAKSEIFVGHRIDVKEDAWQMPQGGINAGETPREAALRELKEEIGTNNVKIVGESKGWLYYDLPPGIAGQVWDGRWRGQRQKWFVMCFLGRNADVNVATIRPEFDRWRWIRLSQLPAIAVSFKRQLYLSLTSEFKEIVSGGISRRSSQPS